ncbi:MAG: WD40 repeat domain-containing protein, partial [bacterium]
KCLAADPARRYANAGEVLADLQARRAGRPVSPLRGSRSYRLKKSVRRNAAPVAVAGIAVLALAGSWWQTARRQRVELIRSYLSQARSLGDAQDDVGAALYYAQVNMLSPSRLARANTLGFLREIAVPAFVQDHEQPVGVILFSPDGRRLVTVERDSGLIQWWDVKSGKAAGNPASQQGSPNGAAFDPTGRVLLTWDIGGTARLWNASTGDPLGAVLRHGAKINDAAFSPDGKYVATVSDDKTARLWDARTGKAMGPPLAHGSLVMRIAFSPDGAILATGAWGGQVQMWTVPEGRKVGKPLLHKTLTGIGWLGYSPDVRTLIVVAERRVYRWDARSGRPIGNPLEHAHTVGSVAFSPDAGMLATASQDGLVQLWRVSDGERVGRLMRHREAAYVVFRPDGRYLLTWSWDGTARLWDGATGEAVGWVMYHRGIVWAATFSPD